MYWRHLWPQTLWILQGLVTSTAPTPIHFIGFGDIYGPKPYKFIHGGHALVLNTWFFWYIEFFINGCWLPGCIWGGFFILILAAPSRGRVRIAIFLWKSTVLGRFQPGSGGNFFLILILTLISFPARIRGVIAFWFLFWLQFSFAHLHIFKLSFRHGPRHCNERSS